MSSDPFLRLTPCLTAVVLAGSLALPGLAQDSPSATTIDGESCALDCVFAQLVATAGEVDGGDVYDPLQAAATTMARVAIAQTRRGQLGQTADTMQRLIELPLTEAAEKRICVTAYTGMAEVFAAAGMDAEADHLFAQALTLANALEDPAKWIHAKIARALLRAQRVEAAQEILNAMSWPEYRAPVIADLAVALAPSTGTPEARLMLEAAFHAVGEVTRGGQSTRVKAFSAIAKALVLLGETDEALVLVSTIEDEYERVATTAALATTLQETGDPTAAQETLERAVSLADAIAEDYHRAWAILAVVEGGDVVSHQLPGPSPHRNRGVATPAAALRLKAMAEALDPSSGGFALVPVAGALAKAGAIAAALDLAAHANDACTRAGALANIAGTQAAAGNIEDARETMARIEPAAPGRARGCGHYNNALEAIAKTHAARGEFATALAILPELELADRRLGALMAIAEAMAQHDAEP